MSLLKAEPQGTVKSLEELFAIAYAMEQEAAVRYADIADRMRAEGNQSLAQVFERLSSDERGHLESVVHWSQQEKGKAPDPAQVRWELPETFDDEGAATADPRLLTAYRSLAMAVRNEERAFAFWSYVAAHASSPDVRRAAESMAHEELGHVALLRRERRRAFHAERSDRQAHRADEDAVIDIASLERRLADLLEALSPAVPRHESDRLRNLAAEARRHAEELARAPISVPGTADRSRIPDDPVALAELLVDWYLEAADRLRDEGALARAQTFAGRAIDRLVWLRTDLPELGGG